MTTRLRNLDKRMGDYQVRWRNRCLDIAENGYQNKVPYDWVLPRTKWEEALWPGIRRNSKNSLQAYLTSARVAKHTGVHNLKSSWTLCANLYFPFGSSSGGRSLLSGFLRAVVDPAIESVDSLDLEFAHSAKHLKPDELLGEIGGSRGSGQTSPDLAFHVNGGRGLVLAENKFVEGSFYRCSAQRTADSVDRPGNPDPSRCRKSMVVQDHSNHCHQTTWGRNYWELLKAAANPAKLAALDRCPASTAGYQLLRQHALAEGIATDGEYDLVISCVAFDERNEVLRRSLRTTGLNDFREWGELFNGKAKFAVFTHQNWVEWVRSHASAEWADWLAYVEDRYDLGPDPEIK